MLFFSAGLDFQNEAPFIILYIEDLFRLLKESNDEKVLLQLNIILDVKPKKKRKTEFNSSSLPFVSRFVGNNYIVPIGNMFPLFGVICIV